MDIIAVTPVSFINILIIRINSSTVVLSSLYILLSQYYRGLALIVLYRSDFSQRTIRDSLE